MIDISIKILTNLKYLMLLSSAIMPTDQGEMNKVEKNGMEFCWQIVGNNLRCTMKAPTTGWVAVGFNEGPDLAGTNLIMGTVEEDFYRVDDRFIVSAGNHRAMEELGAADKIVYRHGTEKGGMTSIEFEIPLAADDKYHVPLKQGREYYLLMAFSREDDFDHHSVMRTSTKIKL